MAIDRMPSDAALGRLEKVDLRTAWATEAGNFTPWLAQSENITLLGEVIGLDLEVEAQEMSVGPFRADILCKDTFSDAWVLIENQLERTDHLHLGQLLTYAAGLDAVTIVWIAQRFTEEHRAALDWLNAITDEQINFFGLELELWRIGDSACAPKFNVVSQPNDWTRSVRSGAHGIEEGTLTETGQMQIDYWTAFCNRLVEHAPEIRFQKITNRYVLPINVGKSGFILVAAANSKDQWIGVELRCERADGKASFRWLQDRQYDIEQEIGMPLEWEESPGQRRSVIRLRRSDVDPSRRDQWASQHALLVDWATTFHRTFSYRLRSLDFDKYETDAEEADVEFTES